ncbi:MAG TPA: methylenetetrahydrofolate--tRNA-(uracil(54)-C(5))-methyltransferase (FADH(2)-oxidizing) TrmFO [Vicinamibacterales bacterium]|jgi:methylenetetrahydrofolate--tRNA-(uracil-5-)-methyltransferase
MLHIIGGGLAGSEAAWQAAVRGVSVTLHEMRPVRGTEVHRTDRLAELVCSNSFRGDKLDNAVGLLKEEMRRAGSLVMRAADAARVPAGAALAVDRGQFASTVTSAITDHPAITLVREEVGRVADVLGAGSRVIVATGPLTSDALSTDLTELIGRGSLYFYDAISPIVLAESIDFSKVFRASRWGRSLGDSRQSSVDSRQSTVVSRQSSVDSRQSSVVSRQLSVDSRQLSVDRRESVDSAQQAAEAEGDYLNCPLTKEEYERFYEAVIAAESATVHDFDKEKFFEGCLPIEVMAHRGVDTLRYGPMKPVGLSDPRTGRQAYAVVQLRQDTLAGDHYSLVGFQTQLKWSDQARVLRLIPGLEQAEFVRLGMVHRNTYINAPTVLNPTWQVRGREDLFIAGQISGVEGYVESAASGLMAGRHAAALERGERPRVPPRSTALGALAHYVSHADPRDYQPTNITFGIMEGLAGGPRDKLARKLAISNRALRDLETWLADDPARDAA